MSAEPPIATEERASIYVGEGPWPCENLSARRERRIVRRNCASSESNLTAHASRDLELENCIFYILQMYEFSHNLGQEPTLAHQVDGCAVPKAANTALRGETVSEQLPAASAQAAAVLPQARC